MLLLPTKKACAVSRIITISYKFSRCGTNGAFTLSVKLREKCGLKPPAACGLNDAGSPDALEVKDEKF